MDQIYKRINDDLEESTDPAEASEIQKFYADKTIFLTGATGFMGNCLVEKLLRSCPDVKRIYVLVRPKKGCSLEERMNKFFDNVLFEPLLKMYPNCKSKLRPMQGDLMSDDLGLSEDDRKTLVEETDFIVHNASNVKFNENIKKALRSNVLGTLAMTGLAKKCKKLQNFTYVSTAFSHCYKRFIKEQVYPPPATIDMVQSIINGPDMSDKAVKQIIGDYPNTYCFTKAAAEDLVNEMGKEVSFKCIICRPSVVISSWKEPLRSWCGNLNGPALLFIGYALGVIRAAYLRDCTVDLVPADLSINAIIVAMWDATKNRTPISGSFVYHCATSNAAPVTFRRLHKLCLPHGETTPTPSIHTIWPFSATVTKCVYYFAILHVLLHFIPAVIIDAYLFVNGKKTQALSAYKKVTLNYSMVLYFGHGDWRIHVDELNKANDRMNSTDRELFFCDIRKFDWADYCLTYWHGLRVYLLKDPMSTVPAAVKKFRRLTILNNVLKYTLLLSILYMIGSYLNIL